MNKMKKLLFSSLIALIAVTGFVTTASASATTVGGKEYQINASTIFVKRSEVYLKTEEVPSSIWYYNIIDGKTYHGYLPLVRLQDAADHWLAYYEGTIYQKLPL